MKTREAQPTNSVASSPAVDFKLTDEQRDFVAAIRDFCQRECGTPEQREQLTKNHTELHNAELYKRMADLGWLGLTIPEEYGGPAAPCSTPASSWRRPRAAWPRSAATPPP